MGLGKCDENIICNEHDTRAVDHDVDNKFTDYLDYTTEPQDFDTSYTDDYRYGKSDYSYGTTETNHRADDCLGAEYRENTERISWMIVELNTEADKQTIMHWVEWNQALEVSG